MSSGGRRIRINLRERGASVDLNRLQSFVAAEFADALKFLFDARADYDVGAGGVEELSSATGNPLRGVVLSGIRARPEIGTVNLFVEPGVGVFVSPDAVPDADDSPEKWVVDPGVLTAGALTLTANASGSTRIDIVECQLTDELVSSETRDIFNPATGAFGSQSVEKVKRRRLSYRIRLGTPGAGFPVTASGWFPIAVASVPTGTTTWNTVIVWDVRLLASDLEFQPFQLSRTYVDAKRKQHVSSFIDAAPAPTQIRLRGEVEAFRLDGHRAGGILDEDASVGYLDILNTANHSGAGTIFGANKPWYLWALFPFGLPRWCRYTPSSSGARKPGPFRGIPVVTSTGPGDIRGKPASAITLPSALGFGAATSDSAVVIVAGLVSTSAAKPWGVEIDGTITWHFMYDAASVNAIASTTSTGDTEIWNFIDNTHMPANCRAMHATFEGLVSSHAVSVRHQLTVRDVGGTFDLWSTEDVVYLKPAIVAHTDRWTRRISHQSTVNNSPGLKTRAVRWTHEVGAQGGTVTVPKATIVGWEMGP